MRRDKWVGGGREGEVGPGGECMILQTLTEQEPFA